MLADCQRNADNTVVVCLGTSSDEVAFQNSGRRIPNEFLEHVTVNHFNKHSIYTPS